MACNQHDGVCEILDDHEKRLRAKRDRMLKLELEANHMSEKMDQLIKQNEAIQASLNGLRTWQIYLMGAAGTVAVIYSVVVAHWPAIVRLFGPAVLP